MKTEYTAEQAASFLLSDTGLSEWQIGFLAVALDEVAEWHERTGNANSIACHECADELTQMNSQHRGSVEPVVYALTSLSFSVSWHGDYGARTFAIEQHERRDLRPRADFDALYDDCGWGSDAHRQALRAQFDPATYEPRSGKSALMNEMVAELAGKPTALAETVIGNCTTSLPFKFKFDPKENGHTVIFAPTRTGMSVGYSALGLTHAEVAEVKIIDKD